MKEVRDIGEILNFLRNTLANEEFSGFSLRFSEHPGESGEIRIEMAGKKKILAVRPLLYPSRRILKDHSPGERSAEVLVAARFPEKLAADLRAAGIAHADLNGRLFVHEDGFLLDRRPGKIRFRPPRSGADPFAAKSSRLVRALLASRNREFTQKKLVKRTGLSPAGVSIGLAELVKQGWVRQEGKASRHGPASYAVEDFDGLLDEWKDRDDWAKRTSIHQFSVLSGQVEDLAKIVEARLGGADPETGHPHLVFSQWFAAWLRHPYTVPPVVTAYLRSGHLPDDLPWRRVSTGGNLWLVVPEDDGVFFETREVRSFHLAADVQIYLDLLQVGLRGPEQAEELRNWDGFAR